MSFLRTAFLAISVLWIPTSTCAYSVLAHEAIIDFSWDETIRPALLARFPGATEQDLVAARKHAYGGSLIQDMGYYPFGQRFFSDLLHYVRTGNFIEELIHSSRDVQEYAFALGTLAHYASDTSGHRLATNLAVPILYPELRAKYGDIITYEEKPSAHLKVEFGFDVLQVARGRYAPEAFHDFIGFGVATSLVERVFPRIYGISLRQIYPNFERSVGSFRHATSDLIPRMTMVAWELKEDEIDELMPAMTRQKFLFRISRRDFESRWGSEYDRPGFLDKFLAFLIRIIPKVGPLKTISFKPPTPETEKLFLQSFETTLKNYTELINEARKKHPEFENKDLDTGLRTAAGEYKLSDETYEKLVKLLEKTKFQGIPPELRQDILAFYGDLSAPISTKQDEKDWRKLVRYLNELREANLQPARIEG